MYVELLEGRYAGQMRDLDNGTALDLIKLGRAKRAFGEPTQAAPRGAGAMRDTTNAPVKSEPGTYSPVVVRLDEPSDKPLVALDRNTGKQTTLTTGKKKK